MSATVTPCGAWTPNGPCGRKVAPGSRCAFHPEHGVNDSESAQPLPPAKCDCDVPLPVVTDALTGEIRCVKCGHDERTERMPDERTFNDILRAPTRAVTEARQLADEIDRRSTEAAERERAEAEARAKAEAEQQSQAAADRAAFNDAIRQPSEREVAKQAADRERLFGPEPPEQEPPTRPEGSANGGEGEPEDAIYEDVQTDAGMQPMRVWDLEGDDGTST